MNIFLGAMAIVLLLGMVADDDKENRSNYKHGFIAVILGMVAFNTIPLFL